MIDLLVDALGRPPRFLFTGGEFHESRTADALLDGVEANAVIAEKTRDRDAIAGTINAALILMDAPNVD